MSIFTRFIHWIESLMNPALASSRRRRRGIGFAVPTSITVSPHTPVVVVGRTTQLYAQNQLGQNAPGLCSWSSSDPTKATIDASTGLVTGVATGTVTFTVSYNSGQFTNSTAAITVAAQTLTSAVMTTAPSSVVTTHTVTFAATGYDQLGFAMTVQPTFSFTSGTPATATINSSTGVATGVATGTSSITATSGAVTTPGVTLTDVAQIATTLVPSPSSLTVSIGSDSSAITAGVFDQLGSPISGATLSFVSNNTGLATVNSGGVVHGVAAGGPVITVSSTVGGGTAQGTVNVTVSTYTLTVSPTSISGAPAGTVQLTVTENGIDVTSDSGTTYATDTPSVATVDAPTFTSISPSTIVQGTGPITYTLTGTNFRSGQTLQGLPTGVTAGSLTFVSGTSITVPLTASGSATTGAASLYVGDTSHGNSGTQTLTVNSSVANLLSAPNDLTNSTYWTPINPSSVSLLSTTRHDGTTGNVSRLVVDTPSTSSGAGTGGGYTQNVTVSGGTASKQFTLSCWAKCETGTGNLCLKSTQGGVVDNYSADKPLTTTWQQFSFVVTNGGSAGSGVQIVGFERGTGTGAGFVFYIDGATLTQP